MPCFACAAAPVRRLLRARRPDRTEKRGVCLPLSPVSHARALSLSLATGAGRDPPPCGPTPKKAARPKVRDDADRGPFGSPDFRMYGYKVSIDALLRA